MNTLSYDNPLHRPCPSWCELAPGHDWDSIETATGRELRGHGRTLGRHASLFLTEYADEPGLCQPTVLGIYVEEAKDWTATEVRELAAELLNAADKLDRFTGAGSDWTEDDL